MGRPILLLTDPPPTSTSRAAHLGELAARGFPVPPGFVVTADACRDFFDTLVLAPLNRGSRRGRRSGRGASVIR